ncbi:TonB-dependent receptor plug domain-containing protein [Peteryoungia ipomoeae]|uniref:TonB-dependent receptor n=1 Tax=Peteryoungia ipomoeae TaxID=1210932 RepID=A0A4S8NVM3_9HYPH|nr:TonB-dependent receptor plug domain-containing protein [Peteryoungia ipomoeae]THV20222.1 TonB-dependent receptor [Peteryoungia ipomoeae]
MTVKTSSTHRALIGAASRRLLTTTACALVLFAGPSSLPALAQSASAVSATHSFDIPAQPLSSALRAFGRQAGLQVSLPAAAARGASSAAVSGTLTTEAALSRLLGGTGLSYRISNGVVVVGDQPSAATGAVPAADASTMLGEITVTGQGDATSVASVNIGAEELAARNPSSVADVFRDEAGVSVGSSIPTSQKVYVNGLEETTLAVTIDGSRQNNRVFHHNATNLIDPSLLKAVNVDAGIAPADAGPGALAGSIAYETKDVKDMLTEDGFGGMVSETYNSNSQTFTTGLGGWAMQDGFEFLGFVNYGKGGNFEAGNGEEVLGTETNLLSGLGKVAYEAESGDRFELSHERVRDDAERPFRANGIFQGRPWQPATRNYLLERQNTVFTYSDTTPEGWWDPTVRLAYSTSLVDTMAYPRPTPGWPTSYPTIGESQSLNGKFENKFALDNGNIVAGIDFYRDQIELDSVTTVPALMDDGTEKATNIGIYSQARLEPFDHTRISFGGRVDKQWFEGVNGEEWDHAGISGNAAVEYDLTSFLTAKAGASHVWAGIPLAESFIMDPNWDYTASGPDVTTANNVMAGLELHHSGYTAEASIFRSSIQNARVAKYTGSLPGVVYPNLNYDVVSEGYELGVGYDWVDGFIKVKYAHITGEVDGQPVNSDTGNYLATPVGDIITLSAAHTFTEWGLTIGGDMEFAPKYESGDTTYKSYEVVNIYTEWKPEQLSHMTFRAEVQNLFNETYASRATYGQEFEADVTPLYEQGRTFLVSVKATF